MGETKKTTYNTYIDDESIMLASSNNLGLLVIVEQSTNYFQQFIFLNQWLNEKIIIEMRMAISCSLIMEFLVQIWLYTSPCIRCG